MKGENSVTSYCIVLMLKSAKMWWPVKEILVSEALGLYFSWILIASIKMMTRTMDGCLILNKLGKRRVNLSQRVMSTLQCSLSQIWAFLLGFSCPTQTAPLSPNIAWRSEERSCAVHSTFCSCEVQNVDSSQNILTAVKLACSFAS